MHLPEGACGTVECPVEEVDSLAAAGQAGEPLQDRGHRDRERERGEGEIKAREPPRGQTEREPGRHCHQPGERDRPEVAKTVVCGQDRGRVGPDRHQRAVAEGDLPRVASHQVEPDNRDEETARPGEFGECIPSGVRMCGGTGLPLAGLQDVHFGAILPGGDELPFRLYDAL